MGTNVAHGCHLTLIALNVVQGMVHLRNRCPLQSQYVLVGTNARSLSKKLSNRTQVSRLERALGGIRKCMKCLEQHVKYIEEAVKTDAAIKVHCIVLDSDSVFSEINAALQAIQPYYRIVGKPTTLGRSQSNRMTKD